MGTCLQRLKLLKMTMYQDPDDEHRVTFRCDHHPVGIAQMGILQVLKAIHIGGKLEILAVFQALCVVGKRHPV